MRPRPRAKQRDEKSLYFALTIRALVFRAHDMTTREEVEEAAREMMDERFYDKDDLEIEVIADTDPDFPQAESLRDKEHAQVDAPTRRVAEYEKALKRIAAVVNTPRGSAGYQTKAALAVRQAPRKKGES